MLGKWTLLYDLNAHYGIMLKTMHCIQKPTDPLARWTQLHKEHV